MFPHPNSGEYKGEKTKVSGVRGQAGFGQRAVDVLGVDAAAAAVDGDLQGVSAPLE